MIVEGLLVGTFIVATGLVCGVTDGGLPVGETVVGLGGGGGSTVCGGDGVDCGVVVAGTEVAITALISPNFGRVPTYVRTESHVLCNAVWV
jgi:hypothetical protein